MKQQLLLLIIFLLPAIAFGQKKYKYKYRQHLTSQSSSFTMLVTDTTLEQGNCNLTFHIRDNLGEALTSETILITGSNYNKQLLSDINGAISVTLPGGTFSVEILSVPFTPLKWDHLTLKENTQTTITASLGKSNLLRIALIYSKRKLTDAEVAKIIDDLSNDRNDNELIKNKTCFILWEI